MSSHTRSSFCTSPYFFPYLLVALRLCLLFSHYMVFFFNQKPPYVMRFSAWSSVVSSSGLRASRALEARSRAALPAARAMPPRPAVIVGDDAVRSEERRVGKEGGRTCSDGGTRAQ